MSGEYTKLIRWRADLLRLRRALAHLRLCTTFASDAFYFQCILFLFIIKLVHVVQPQAREIVN